MTIQKLALEPGVNREKTSYSNENSWFECDKVRFRQGYAERIGGWTRISANSFLGVCRSLFNWISLAGANYLGVGTNLKFYIGQGGAYYDVTPLRATTAAGDVTFAASNGSSTLTVSDTDHAAAAGALGARRARGRRAAAPRELYLLVLIVICLLRNV